MFSRLKEKHDPIDAAAAQMKEAQVKAGHVRASN